jgi:hypothetical protein
MHSQADGVRLLEIAARLGQIPAPQRDDSDPCEARRVRDCLGATITGGASNAKPKRRGFIDLPLLHQAIPFLDRTRQQLELSLVGSVLEEARRAGSHRWAGGILAGPQCRDKSASCERLACRAGASDTDAVPKTIDVDVSRQMNTSPEAVWAVVEDLNRLPEWLAFASTVEDVSGLAEPGATYTVKPTRSYEPTTHWRVAESEKPLRQLHTSEMPVVSGVRSELTLSPSNDGVTVRVHWTGTPKGVVGKVMSGMMQKRITQNWERSLEQLERAAQAGAG